MAFFFGSYLTIFNCERLAGKHAGLGGADHLVLGGGGGAGGGASFAAAALVFVSLEGASEVEFEGCVGAGRGIVVAGDGEDVVVTVVDPPAERRRIHFTVFVLVNPEGYLEVGIMENGLKSFFRPTSSLEDIWSLLEGV